MNIDTTKLVTAQQRAAEAAAASNTVILAQIVAIENDLQPRATREYFLSGDKTRLQEIEDKVVALRAQLI
ncbi:hypothetical protein [Collimonas humicola]|uniref:hypothetical protein n=1 Tax=Collimonas humicola TaxID=2825886 RepID=UPI001B8BE287|nr:hypothetical protein [Collimonas humicola]